MTQSIRNPGSQSRFHSESRWEEGNGRGEWRDDRYSYEDRRDSFFYRDHSFRQAAIELMVDTAVQQVFTGGEEDRVVTPRQVPCDRPQALLLIRELLAQMAANNQLTLSHISQRFGVDMSTALNLLRGQLQSLDNETVLNLAIQASNDGR
ncbi:MAG TPA: hypothetical protein PK018_10715 [Candidatus Competibacter sp.]|nr:hypothetical protein [Candidatus Competibacter sp.]